MESFVVHPLAPIFDRNSKVLILGSMPSVYSRKIGFYYGHPNNRFWKVLECLFCETIEDRQSFLLKKRIALWDVLASCSINHSNDASIHDAKPNDLDRIIKYSSVKAIFTTGKTAYSHYLKFFKDKISLPVFCLPSTSSANCKMKLDDLIKEYAILKTYLE